MGGGKYGWWGMGGGWMGGGWVKGKKDGRGWVMKEGHPESNQGLGGVPEFTATGRKDREFPVLCNALPIMAS